METTIVHVVRHGQVHNPTGVLYGRLPGYRLSDLGQRMASRLGEYFAQVPLVALRCSPLQRATETMAPVAAAHPDLEVVLDNRIIEASTPLEGRVIVPACELLLDPRNWWYFRNPIRPSWNEPYRQVAMRMRLAITETAQRVRGGQAVLMSHELPIWVARLQAEGRGPVHDPRKRMCRLASVTSFHFRGDTCDQVSYTEPCADLYPGKNTRRTDLGV